MTGVWQMGAAAAAAAGAGQCSAFIVAALIIAFEVTTKLRG